MVRDYTGVLCTTEQRDRLTLALLRRFGVHCTGLQRRCRGCGSSMHGAVVPNDQPRLSVSRTRSRFTHAIAVQIGGWPLGLDVEMAERAEQATRAAPKFIGADDEPLRDRMSALRIFVRKEAILKARGIGLHFDPRRQATVPVQWRDSWLCTRDGWWLREWDADGMILCLATSQSTPVRMYRCELTPELRMMQLC
jgi:hypothetical protein